MRCVLAPDSFKECMTAARAAVAMEAGVLAAAEQAECIRLPLSDGGEGLVDTLTASLGARAIPVTVTGPLGQPVTARYGYLDRERLAIIEVAAAAGLELIPAEERDPRATTSYGVGELVRHALTNGARRILIGLGGSATNDAGTGMLRALGARLLDADGDEIPLGGAALSRLRVIDRSTLDPRLATVRFEVACDVTNPLLGEHGATRVFGPQKGATSQAVMELEHALWTFAAVARQELGRRIDDAQGSGAAGGLGAALLGFLGATIESGAELVMRVTNLEQFVAGADVVLTGEGSIDAQTLMGKVPLGVVRLAARHRVPAVGFAGRVGPGGEALLGSGMRALVPISEPGLDRATALRAGPAALERAVATVIRRWVDTGKLPAGLLPAGG